VADGWCWFVLREEYCWLVAGGWFVLREKYCWLVADKPSEQAGESSRSYLCLLVVVGPSPSGLGQWPLAGSVPHAIRTAIGIT
jgi:hypothetical protein